MQSEGGYQEQEAYDPSVVQQSKAACPFLGTTPPYPSLERCNLNRPEETFETYIKWKPIYIK